MRNTIFANNFVLVWAGQKDFTKKVIKLIMLKWIGVQCDQMSILFFQYLPIFHNENTPKRIENVQIELIILPNNK